MTFSPATELVSKVPPPKVGRSSRRISGLVSVAVVGRWVVLGADVVVVGGRVVDAVDGVVDGGVVWLVVGPEVVGPVGAVEGVPVDPVLAD